MKQIDLAKLLGIGRIAVSMFLAGDRPITAIMLADWRTGSAWTRGCSCK